ncbi:MAG TPA: hypothetical protein PK771_07715, partial [Spirochaetota bacterium]|nr:hypothetical protein [Spirochaetota bacterium]
MRKYLILFFIVCFAFNLFPQLFGKKAPINYLFINSYPIRAKVLFDGKDTNTLTPCILRNLNPDVKIS